MASDLGATPIEVEFIRGGTLGQNWVDIGVLRPTRSIWYARYIDWTITTPLLLLELALTTALPLSQIFGLVFFGTFTLLSSCRSPWKLSSIGARDLLADLPLLFLLADIVMIITGLLGALTASRYKWGFYVFVSIDIPSRRRGRHRRAAH